MKNRFKVILMVSIAIVQLQSQDTILDIYIAEPDPNYTWDLHSSLEGPGFTAYNILLTSLQWRDESDVDLPLWQHWLSVLVPDEVSYETAYLLISGGGRHPEPPDLFDDEIIILGNLAVYTQSVMAILSTVPNQPLMFADENFTRSEDAIIAYSWDKFLTTGDANWPVNLAMTKSAVHAMDAMEELGEGLDPMIPISEFVVGGASKRGWTTWLTAAADDRVVAITPMVFDALNLITSFRQHWGSYGEWSFAVNDYVEMEIFDWFDDPEINDLLDVVDPFSYKERLDMPKYIIAATGDEFFVPAAQNYIHDLPGENMMGYYPNVGHGFADDAILALVQNLTVFYQSILTDTPLPEINWVRLDDGSLLIDCISIPMEAKLWQATNPESRDFRHYSLDPDWVSPEWTATELMESDEDGVYHAQLQEPETGWTAFMVEFVFDLGFEYPFSVTTEVSTIPDDMPYATDVTVHVLGNAESNYALTGSLTAWDMIPLYDDGTHGDTFAGDGEWTAVIPALADGSYSWNVYSINEDGNAVLINGESPLTVFVIGDEVSGETVFSASIHGDVIKDGVVNILDIVMTVNIILNSEFNAAADLNSDGAVDVMDVVMLVNIILR